MKNLPTLLLLSCSALFTVVGCGSSDGSASPADEPASTPGTDDSELKKDQLSQDLICAAVSAANDMGDPSGLKSVPQSKLKGDALKDFRSWQRGFAGDYPSQAFELPVTLKGKTYTFILVTEMNDGGGSTGIYREDGRTVTWYSAGESGDINWSAPGDKCQ
jgi:hypothetical protein